MYIHLTHFILISSSALVCDMVEAARNGSSCMNVSVVVADSPFPPTGSDMVKQLAAMGVPTYYRLITDVTHIMHKVSLRGFCYALSGCHHSLTGLTKR